MNIKKIRHFALSGNPVIDLALLFIIGIIIVRVFLPFQAIPFVFEYFWPLKGTFLQALLSAWPLFLAGFALNLWKMATTTNPPEVQSSASSIPWNGFLLSLSAGVLEEIAFRWVLLYGFMGLIWTITVAFLPRLEGFVRNDLSWLTSLLIGHNASLLEVVGVWTLPLAFLLSNFKFQQGHLYQGMTGFIFSWFGGLFFARIFFQYSLFYAIGVHFLFDWMVFLMLWVDLLLESNIGLTGAKNRFYHWYSYQ